MSLHEGFFGKLCKASEQKNKKMRDYQLYAVKRVIFNHQEYQNMSYICEWG
jgi:hypothetical protein